MLFHNNWLLLALIAPLLWALVVLIDDNLLRKVYRSAGFGAMVAGLFGIFPFLYLSITNETYTLPTKVMAAAIASGVLTIVFYYCYFKALSSEEPSTTIALLNLMPVFVVILAALFLHESLLTKQYIGIGVIVLSSTYLGLMDARKFKLNSAISYVIAGSFVYAVASILAKFAYDQASFRTVFPWISFGFFITGATIYIFGRHSTEAKRLAKKAGVALVLVMFTIELLNFGAEFTQGLAISRGPVSIIRAIEGIQPLYILLLAIVLGPFLRSFFREQVDSRFPRKVLAMLVMIGGLYLIAS